MDGMYVVCAFCMMIKPLSMLVKLQSVKSHSLYVESDRFHRDVWLTEACQNCDGCFVDGVTKPVWCGLLSVSGKGKQNVVGKELLNDLVCKRFHFLLAYCSSVVCSFVETPMRHLFQPSLWVTICSPLTSLVK